MNKKIVFFDIDGTIYTYKKGIPKDTSESILRLKEMGHIPVICTGRTKAMIFDELLELNMNAFIAGAGTYLEIDGNVIYQYEMKSEDAKDIIACMRDCNIMPIPEGINQLYFPLSDMNDEYQEVFGVYAEKIPDKICNLDDSKEINVSKISGFFTKNSRLDSLNERFGSKFNLVIHGDKLVEMIPKEYSKAVGIQRLIQYYNEKNTDKILLDNTYAYGDSMNDYEMLQYVRYGVAMGNSSFEFKNKIQYVTEDYDKGGISFSLKRFGLI